MAQIILLHKIHHHIHAAGTPLLLSGNGRVDMGCDTIYPEHSMDMLNSIYQEPSPSYWISK